jgi:hypothetical protein
MESETKHTPGPWIASGAKVLDKRQTLLADVHQTASRPSADESAANARLIAAAPELYEALRVLLDAAESLLRETGGVEPAGLRMARAALARAVTP